MTYLNASKLAEHLGLREKLVYELAARGEIPSYKIGSLRRFKLEEVESWMESKRQGPRLAEVRELRRAAK